MKRLITLLVSFSLLIGIAACSNTVPEESKPTETTPVTHCDLTQYANIKSAELVELFGEPDHIAESSPATGFVDIPCVFYDYNSTDALGEVSFVLVNDAVVQLISYKEFSYTDKNTLLECFCIDRSAGCAVVTDNDITVRYRCPSKEIDDFWVTNIDVNSQTFDFLKVTYDMSYFEEWYLPMDLSEQSDYQYFTKEYVKSILKAPNSADFPNISEWSFGKNKFYISVYSYVDAQNSFGATTRSEFYFIYPTGTTYPIYVILDDQIIVDENYISSAELIKQLVSGTLDEVEDVQHDEPVVTETESPTEPVQDAPADSSSDVMEEPIFSSSDAICYDDGEPSMIESTDLLPDEYKADVFENSELHDSAGELAEQEYLEDLPSLDDFEWEYEEEYEDTSDLDGIVGNLSDEERAWLEQASGE